MKNLPTQQLVSVIIPVYNGQDYISRAIDSILAQTYRHLEIIIINDASTDGTKAILQTYKRKYPKIITVINLKKNRNMAGDACANIGIKRSKGAYIARLDADDAAMPRRIEEQVAYMEKHPTISIIGTQAIVIDKDDAVLGRKIVPTKMANYHRDLMKFNPVIHPSMMMRRYLPDGRLFHYDLKFSANNDYYTFFKLYCQGVQIRNMSKALVYHRIHGENETFNNIKKNFANTLHIRAEMIRDYGYQPEFKQVLTTLAQAVVIAILPEKVITNLYLITKGIKKVSFPTLSFSSFSMGKKLATS